jgi:predicted nucleic acid-binding protein
MIVVDTTVLVYAIGADHPLRDPCRRLVAAVGEGRVEATTTVEALQELVHVQARRRTRGDAARHGRALPSSWRRCCGPRLTTSWTA